LVQVHGRRRPTLPPGRRLRSIRVRFARRPRKVLAEQRLTAVARRTGGYVPRRVTPFVPRPAAQWKSKPSESDRSTSVTGSRRGAAGCRGARTSLAAHGSARRGTRRWTRTSTSALRSPRAISASATAAAQHALESRTGTHRRRRGYRPSAAVTFRRPGRWPRSHDSDGVILRPHTGHEHTVATTGLHPSVETTEPGPLGRGNAPRTDCGTRLRNRPTSVDRDPYVVGLLPGRPGPWTFAGPILAQ
jgi:hypothetical protein